MVVKLEDSSNSSKKHANPSFLSTMLMNFANFNEWFKKNFGLIQQSGVLNLLSVQKLLVWGTK